MTSKNFRRLATIGGASVVALGAFTLHLGIVVEAVIAAAAVPIVGGGIWKFWPNGVTETAKDIKQAIDNAGKPLNEVKPSKLVNDTISIATKKLDAIVLSASAIRAPNTTRQINKLVATGRKIVEDIRQDPNDVGLVQSWANSYLDETLNLVKGYAVLSLQGTTNIEAQRQMAKFDEMLDTLEKQFTDLLKRCVENDVLDFDITMSVMNNRLKQEGM